MKILSLSVSIVFCLFGPLIAAATEEVESTVSDSWMKNAMEHIEKEEYKPSLQKSDYKGELFDTPKYHFANRANNLRAYFDENGMELIPRVITDKEKWNLKIKSIAVKGGNNDKKIIGDIDFDINGDNISSSRNGIKIKYSNSESGIEQNISIEENIGSEDNLTIDLIIEAENLNIKTEKDRFVLKNGEKEIIYQINGIKDADENEISYSLSEKEGNLNISTDSRNIVYPINISTGIHSTGSSGEELNVTTSAKSLGLSQSPAWSAEPDLSHVNFGEAVSTAGDVNNDGYSDVIVGTPWYDGGSQDEGRAYVYHGSSSGLSATPDWTDEPDQIRAYFGVSVSTAGDVNGDGYSDVIVGAEGYDGGGGDVDEGCAFVYLGSSGGLSASFDWSAESNQDSAYFGKSVSSAGDVNGDGYSDVIVGAYRYDGAATDGGKTFVYHGSPSGLSASPDWTAETGQDSAWYGYSVSCAGDVNGDGYSDVIVGSPHYEHGEENEGVADVFHGSPSGLSASHDWRVDSDDNNANYGYSVSGAGDVNGDGYSDVIVGAPFAYYDGLAFVYHGSSEGLPTTAVWTEDSPGSYEGFGYSVSSAGDVNGDGYSDVIVGSPYYNADDGHAFAFYGSTDGLSSRHTTATKVWTASLHQDSTRFGYSVSSAGDVNGDGYSDVIVGAPGYSNGETEEGGAFVYHGRPESEPNDTSDWMVESDKESARFGWSVSSAGDVNGDGYSDVIVGAPYYDNGQSGEGMAFVYNGNFSGLPATPYWSAESDQEGAHFGSSVSSAGDVNNDGYSDVIVGAPLYDNVGTNEGLVFVYHGSPSGPSLSSDWLFTAGQENARVGTSVSSAGDVNGDGYSDVIIGARYYDNGETDEGAAFVYHGSSSGLPAAALADWFGEGNQAEASFGTSVSSAGDVNGDGYSDVIVGAPYYDNGNTEEGGAFVYHGSSSGLLASADWTAECDEDSAFFGWSVSSAGDINGDGYSDVIVGAYGADDSEVNDGKAGAYYGSASGLSPSADWIVVPTTHYENGHFGYSVSSAGDINNDGYSDVIVGAVWWGDSDEGWVNISYGRPSGLSYFYQEWRLGDQVNAQFGYSVSSAGDVNGDGCSDMIVGAPQYNDGESLEGGAFVYHGSKGGGLALIPTQSTTDGSRHVQLGNATGTSGVQLNILGRTPGGRGKVKLQWEVKELGELFDGTSISESDSWYDTDTNGIEISEDVTGLSEATAYHWRVRLKYDPVTYNDGIHSRWLSIGPNGWNETDFITTSMSGIEDNTDENANIQLNVFPSVSTNIFSIRFSISEEEAEEDISLKVYNKAGRTVKNLFTGRKKAGIHTIRWNGNNNLDKQLPNDVYFIALKKGKAENPVKKIVLLR
jgi:hypothetical protein